MNLVPLHDQMQASAPGTGKIGVVITAYKIGPVLTDTIQCIFEQQGIDLTAVVVVVDGCSFVRSTRAICNRYARTYPNFHTIWLTNGGVSRARNAGLRWLLDQHEDLEAVFVLDGDDIILPNAIASNLKALRDHQQAEPQRSFGWVYFDQQEFGTSSKGLRYPRTFSAFRWFGSNLSQPSCLYAAEMFRAGVFWDEDMRNGIEDWEYWYQAVSAGFVGAYDPNTTLRYRRLTGNRSSLNRGKDALTKRYMRGKHSALLTPAKFLVAEQTDFQRWAQFDQNLGGWTLGTDPDLPGTRFVSPAVLETAVMVRSQQYARASYFFDPYFPDLVMSVSPLFKSILSGLKLSHGLLFSIEQLLQSHVFCTVRFVVGNGDETRITTEYHDMTADRLVGSALTAVSITRFIQACRTGFDWNTLSTEPGDKVMLLPPVPAQQKGVHAQKQPERQPVKMAELTIHLPNGSDPPRPQDHDLHAGALKVLNSVVRKTIDALGDLQFIIDVNKYCAADKAAHAPLARELFGIWPMLPMVPSPDSVDVALILPHECGTEWFALARHLIDGLPDGGRLHLAALGGKVPAVPQDIAPHVGSRMTLGFPIKPPSVGKLPHYFGVPLYERALNDRHQSLIGCLAGMTGVMNLAGPQVSGALVSLKKLGVRTAVVFPDKGRFASSECLGTTRDPMTVQSYINAYDAVVVADTESQGALESIGVPAARIDIGGARWIEVLREKPDREAPA